MLTISGKIKSALSDDFDLKPVHSFSKKKKKTLSGVVLDRDLHTYIDYASCIAKIASGTPTKYHAQS